MNTKKPTRIVFPSNNIVNMALGYAAIEGK